MTGGELAVCGDDRVFQKGFGNEDIIFAGLGVVENFSDLPQVSGAEKKGIIGEGFIGEPFEGFGLDDEHIFTLKRFDTNPVGGDEAVRGVIIMMLNHRGIGIIMHRISPVSYYELQI